MNNPYIENCKSNKCNRIQISRPILFYYVNRTSTDNFTVPFPSNRLARVRPPHTSSETALSCAYQFYLSCLLTHLSGLCHYLGMAALHIRDIGDIQLREWKVAAAKEGKTLKGWVVGRLRGSDSVSEVRDVAPVQVFGGQVSSADGASKSTKSVSTCVHGTTKGFHCWQCGGMAKI